MSVRALSLPGRTARPADIGQSARRVLHTLAEECSDTSYCALPIKQIAERAGFKNHSCGRAALKRLAMRGLIEGHWQIGFRLTERGWRVLRGDTP